MYEEFWHRYEQLSWSYSGMTWASRHGLQPGDRVRIKEGYDRAGDVFYYDAKTLHDSERVFVNNDASMRGFCTELLADAIEPYPYTREERIERAIEDIEGAVWSDGDGYFMPDLKAAIYAILDAGI